MYPKPILGPGLCECGCGTPTGFYDKNNAKRGFVKGAPQRFALGHKSTGGPVVFWARVPDHLPADQCWEWQGSRNPKGYGWFGAGNLVHRMVYTVLVGAVPDGLQVCHACDNPPCCNPAHLWLGTNDDNQADKKAKGRSKLTWLIVDEIRELYAAGETQVTLAERFGVSQGTVSAIVRRELWKEKAS